MTITELIELLEKARDKYNDLPVVTVYFNMEKMKTVYRSPQLHVNQMDITDQLLILI